MIKKETKSTGFYQKKKHKSYTANFYKNIVGSMPLMQLKQQKIKSYQEKDLVKIHGL